MFTGSAFGPILGSLLIRASGQLLSVFYGATVIHLIYAFLIWFILPQSLSLSYRLRAREKHAQEQRKNAADSSDRFAVRVLLFVKRLFAFLAPLSVFAPMLQKANNPLKRAKRDWTLTYIALAYMATISVMVCIVSVL
jgi:MFS family permease